VANYVDRPFRTPGERLKTFPEKVWSQYDCDEQKLPFFEIERLEIVPRRVQPGGEFGHRMVYVMCPATQTGVVTGSLVSRIRHRGKVVMSERQRAYDLRPGRWVIDAFVTLPGEVDTGVYAFELEFNGRGVDFERSLTFAVEQ
jgi:hypothetical protein